MGVTQPGTVTVTGWLVIEGTVRRNTIRGKTIAQSIRIAGVRSNKPPVGANQEAIEITIELPDDYWDDQNPRLTVKVPPRQQGQATATITATVKPKAPSAAASIFRQQP